MERVRTFQWEDPQIGAVKAMQMDGFDYLSAILKGDIPVPPIMKTLDMRAESFDKGKAVFAFDPQEFH